MFKSFRPYLSLAAGLLALPGCPMLDAETEVPETCASYHGLQIPAMPLGQASLAQSFTFDDLAGFGQLEQLDASVQLTRATATATSGIADLSFVKTASLMIASGDPSSTLPSLVAFGCQDCVSSGDHLDIATSTAIDTKDYLSAGSLVVNVDLVGTLPAVDWTMDVEVCMSGKASYSYSP